MALEDLFGQTWFECSRTMCTSVISIVHNPFDTFRCLIIYCKGSVFGSVSYASRLNALLQSCLHSSFPPSKIIGTMYFKGICQQLCRFFVSQLCLSVSSHLFNPAPHTHTLALSLLPFFLNCSIVSSNTVFLSDFCLSLPP